MNPPLVDMKSYGCPYLMESLNSCSTRVNGEHIVFGVIDDSENVGVTTYKDVGKVGVDELECLVVVSSGVSADVHHKNPFSLTFKYLCIWSVVSHFRVIAVSVYSNQRLEFLDFEECLLIPKVSCVPDLVHGGEKFFNFLVKKAMCV